MSKKKIIEEVVKTKTKKVKVKIEEENPVKISVETPEIESEVPAASEPVKIFFDGNYVVDILDDGKGNEKEYHCKMSDGTTTLVPKELFIKEE